MVERSTAVRSSRCLGCIRGLVLGVVLFCGAREARADDGAATPFQLYEQGKRSYDAGDYATAGALLARADALAPNAAVLDLAMAAARKADDPILGMELVERADKRGLASTVRSGREVFASRVGLLSVSCPGSTKCEAHVDGIPFHGERSPWLRVGAHAVVLESDANAEEFSVRVEGDTTLVVRPTRIVEVAAKSPPPSVVMPFNASPRLESDRADGERRRWSSGWFWGGVVTTGALGAATAVSGFDTLATRSQFRADTSSDELASSGKTAETRTNVLLVSTLVVAVATTAVGYLVTEPSHHGR